MGAGDSISSNIVGQGRARYDLPYRSGSDKPLSLPLAPKTQDVTSPYLTGTLDVRWDNPATYPQNQCYEILGVNVYRTFDSPYAAYTLLNTDPIGGRFYRDQTRVIDVVQEDALDTLNPGNNPRGEWLIRTKNYPILDPRAVREDNQDFLGNFVRDIVLEIDPGDGSGWQTFKPLKVNGQSGEITLISQKIWDNATSSLISPPLPNPLTGGVRISYQYVDEVNMLKTNVNRKIYYKVTTVGIDPETSQIVETPLNEVQAISPYDMEKVDWMWAEAIRRNLWILDQGGERVRLFIRKWSGHKCGCLNGDYGYQKNGWGSKDGCPICYNTGFMGGYEGPYLVYIAPPETEKSVNLLDSGLHITYDWLSWMGPEPLINDRDVIVRQNNDRFFIHNVNAQGSRGAIYQQHFSLSQVDTGDPIYRIPITGGESGVPEGWNRFRSPNAPTDASPVMAQKDEATIPHWKTLQARTVTFENIMY